MNINRGWLIIFFLLLFQLSSFSQAVDPIQIAYHGEWYWKYEDVDTFNNMPFKWYYKRDSEGEYLGKSQRFPRDGKWIGFFEEDTSKVASVFEVKDSLLHGKLIQYYFNGQKDCEYSFFKGEEHGVVKYWSKKGILGLEYQFRYKDFGHFQMGVKVGQQKTWDNQGNLSSIENYNQEGDHHGVQLEYYENGQIKKEKFYRNGKRDSTLSFFHPNGQLQSSMRYKEGLFIPENPYYEYHANGQIAGVGDRKDSRKEGKWTYYYENGVKKSEGSYQTYIFDHDHGPIYFYGKSGFWEYWYSNGNLMASGSYNSEKMDTWDFDSRPEIAIPLRKSDWLFYDPRGNVISQADFNQLGYKIPDY
jgi:antitoxin component YwqK of YwqJK toxin-antitoxin module